MPPATPEQHDRAAALIAVIRLPAHAGRQPIANNQHNGYGSYVLKLHGHRAVRLVRRIWPGHRNECAPAENGGKPNTLGFRSADLYRRSSLVKAWREIIPRKTLNTVNNHPRRKTCDAGHPRQGLTIGATFPSLCSALPRSIK